MIVMDEAAQKRYEALCQQEAELDRRRKWAIQELEDCKAVLDPHTSPANMERQLGRQMRREDFEKKLQQLDRNFTFEVVPGNPTKKYLWHLRPGGRVKVCLYENSPMLSEYSLFSTKEDTFVDPTIKHISRKDLPEAKWKGLEYDPDTDEVRGEGYVFDGPRPGMITSHRPWNEIVRGWRTVVANIVQVGLASPEQVERIFGASERRTWAARMGKVEQKGLFN